MLFFQFRRFSLAILLAAILCAPAKSWAAVEIDISSGAWRPINIEIEPFLGESALPHIVSDIVAADLHRSGGFRPRRPAESHYGKMDEKLLSSLRRSGMEYVLSGAVIAQDDSQVQVDFELTDVVTGRSLGANAYTIPPEQSRLAGHYIANLIFEKITDKAGIFHTKIAYIVKHQNEKNERRFELKVADYDGYNAQAVLSHDEPMISPAWSPDGNALLYVSFELNKPIIYWQSLLDGERRVIANFRGNNSAPAMAPNMRRVAAALSKDGPTQIYLVSLDGQTVQPLREGGGESGKITDFIDTEPDFSPDGKRMIFVSDETGSPQIYEFNLEARKTRRLTFGGRYAVSPKYSRDGNLIIFVRTDENGYNIAVMDPASLATESLTEIGLADSPSFSPNGEIVLFKDERRPRRLFTVSINGKVITPSDRAEAGEVVDPAWGPARANWY